MNHEQADSHGSAIEACLGEPGRMIALSKSAYQDDHPLHLAVFNANICFEEGKVWWGDFDLTVEEARVARLAAKTGETVYVLYELDGRFRFEGNPQLERAVYSVTPSGHSRYDHVHIERRADGVLYRRPPIPRPRFRRPARPRTWRVWRIGLSEYPSSVRFSVNEWNSAVMVARAMSRLGESNRVSPRTTWLIAATARSSSSAASVRR